MATSQTSGFRPSPFLDPTPVARDGSLALLHLSREHSTPTILQSKDTSGEGYLEGRVTNTRFGSFPHSTLIGVPWGSQVRASVVDTGSRGRKDNKGKKRKRGDDTENGGTGADEEREFKQAVVAASGFAHLLPPTPESWTLSLPHRTQVVYTPDYSYILHRLRARPGTIIIEAGAGSGSFTHAAARAVFNGYPETHAHEARSKSKKRKRYGKVYSYEFHSQRVEKLQKEIQEHGLDGVVQITHRDVCHEGFCIDENRTGEAHPTPQADAIFLDLPAPWLALPHLSRNPAAAKNMSTSATPSSGTPDRTLAASSDLLSSPLNPAKAIHICCFSPCIEQVTRTVSTLRKLGWVDVEMVELAHRNLAVRRERVGLAEEGIRGGNPSPKDVNEAIARLKEVEDRFRRFHEKGKEDISEEAKAAIVKERMEREKAKLQHQKEREVFKEGKLVSRIEQEVKEHTSYLVFAVLPREWSAEDEERCRQQWPLKPKSSQVEGSKDGKGKKGKIPDPAEPEANGVTEEQQTAQDSVE